MDQTTRKLAQYRCIPMAKVFAKEQAGKLSEALHTAGLPVVNVSQQHPDGAELVRTLAKDPTLLVGSGNVQTYDQALHALDNGARFLFSPLFDERMIALAQQQDIPIFPVTTQIAMAELHHLKVLGCYPVTELGGLAFINKMGEEGGLSFIVAGHIEESMMEYYLSNPHVLAMTGSWMFADGSDWKTITKALVRAASWKLE